MRAVELTGVVDEQGNLSLNNPVQAIAPGAVRVIILYPDPLDQPLKPADQNPDNTSVKDIKASLRRSLQQATTGQRIPLSQMWEGIDTE